MPSPPSPARLVPGWARRPALPIGLLGVAVAVSVAHGQPPPADRASGVSVPVRTDTPAPPLAGTLLMVAGGGVVRFDTDTRQQLVEPLPPGVAGLRVWTVGGVDIALGRLPYRPITKLPPEDRPAEQSPAADPATRTAAWVVRPGRPAVPLGPAETVVPSADGRTVWLVNAGVASRVALHRDQRRRTVVLPALSRLVADTPAGLIVTTGTVLGRDQPTPEPTATTTAAAPPAGPTPTTQTGRGGQTTGAAVEPRTLPVTASAAEPSSPPGNGGPDGGAADDAADGEADSGAGVVPLSTMLVRGTGFVRVLADAEALAGYGETVLVRRADERLGVVTLRGPARPPTWLPTLSAVEVTGPAAVDYDGATFAVLARVNEHVRLMVGSVEASTEADIKVVALEGGPPEPDAAPPAFTASGRVLAVRPDGKVVYYLPGGRQGRLLGDDLPPASAVVQG